MDERVFVLINQQWTSPALDRLMAAVSSLDLWLPFLVALVLLAAWRGGRRGRLFLLSLGILMFIGETVIDNPLKHAIHRPRPYQAVANVRQVDLARRARPRFLGLFKPLSVIVSPVPGAMAGATPGRSFPSSHVVNNFCAAVALTCFYRWGWLYFAPAALVAYSRIYVGAHWPSDVLFSACLAIVYAAGMLALLRLLVCRWRPGWLLPVPPGPRGPQGPQGPQSLRA